MTTIFLKTARIRLTHIPAENLRTLMKAIRECPTAAADRIAKRAALQAQIDRLS